MFKTAAAIVFVALALPCVQGQAPRSAEDYLKSGITHFQSGDTSAALTDLNAALELNPNFVDAFLMRAAIRSKLKDSDGVLADYSKAIELAPAAKGIEAVFTNRGMVRLQRGDINGALADLERAVSINPQVAEIYNGRAIVRLQKGDLAGALADYERVIELKPSMPSAFLGRGYFRYQKQDFIGALADLNKAIELKPDYADAYVDRGLVSGLSGDIDAAVIDMKKGAALNARSISDERRGNFSSPFLELNQFITRNPGAARAYLVRGVFRILQQKEAEAEQDFRQSAELDASIKSEIEKVNRALRKPD